MNISLYIPHIFVNVTKEKIAVTFEHLRIGRVMSIDLIHKIGKDEEYNSAYIHFEYWYNNIVALNFQERVLNANKEARIVYDDPWYWIVFENTSKKHISGNRKLRISVPISGDGWEVLEDEEENEAVHFVTPSSSPTMLTNKDFSDMFKTKAPVKKLNIAPALSQIAPTLRQMICQF